MVGVSRGQGLVMLDVLAGRQLTQPAKACSDIKTCRLLQGGSQGLYGARNGEVRLVDLRRYHTSHGQMKVWE